MDEMNASPSGFPCGLRVASFTVVAAECVCCSPEQFACRLHLATKDARSFEIDQVGSTVEEAISKSLSQVCRFEVAVEFIREACLTTGDWQAVVLVSDIKGRQHQGVGRFTHPSLEMARLIASFRAANSGGLLNKDFRANNQKVLRSWAAELTEELADCDEHVSAPGIKRLESQAIVLDYLNRAASAAVVTATNHPRQDSVLSLYDTSAWLYDANGQRRAAFMDTDSWLAWYPGVGNDDELVRDIVESMPRAPESKIPWIVRLFENPESWIRFRGAVDLMDHDCLHVLLGRGLQDQDEAFVIGFAMGTAKRVSWLQYWIFKYVIARLYPEPYRIPAFLQPAFDLGVQCGKATGAKDLYRLDLKQLLDLPLAEARQRAEIDMNIVGQFLRREQEMIPFTIASLRLP